MNSKRAERKGREDFSGWARLKQSNDCSSRCICTLANIPLPCSLSIMIVSILLLFKNNDKKP